MRLADKFRFDETVGNVDGAVRGAVDVDTGVLAASRLGRNDDVGPGRDLDRLIAAFNPIEGRAIIVPTRRGKRGNPVLWARRFFPEMIEIAGDVGAKHLIGEHAELVAEVEMDSDSVLVDIDTPDALAELRARVKPSAA